jgi:hypothetical protein
MHEDRVNVKPNKTTTFEDRLEARSETTRSKEIGGLVLTERSSAGSNATH